LGEKKKVAFLPSIRGPDFSKEKRKNLRKNLPQEGTDGGLFPFPKKGRIHSESDNGLKKKKGGVTRVKSNTRKAQKNCSGQQTRSKSPPRKGKGGSERLAVTRGCRGKRGKKTGQGGGPVKKKRNVPFFREKAPLLGHRPKGKSKGKEKWSVKKELQRLSRKGRSK